MPAARISAPKYEDISDGSEKQHPWMAERFELATAVLGICVEMHNSRQIDYQDVDLALETVKDKFYELVKEG